MFKSVEDFRNSGIWKNTRNKYVFMRFKGHDFVTCDRCGKKILTSYDGIVHHKIELSNSNINNPDVALNSDNFEFLCHDCHDKEHKRFKYQGLKTVYVVHGCPCSGKSTYVREHAHKNDLIIDIDRIYTAVSINDIYDKPKAIQSAVFNVYNSLLDMVKRRYGSWENAYVITSNRYAKQVERMVDELKAEYIHIPCEYKAAMDRMKRRLDNHKYMDEKLWMGLIDEYYEYNQD